MQERADDREIDVAGSHGIQRQPGEKCRNEHEEACQAWACVGASDSKLIM